MRRLASCRASALRRSSRWRSAPGGIRQPTYRVDAIFDNARPDPGPGREDRAARRWAQVNDVHLTEDRKARVEMEIEERFAPFREDAELHDPAAEPDRREVRAVHPGTPDRPRSRSTAAARRRSPSSKTHSPVDLDLVFAALRRPSASG